MNTLSSRVSGLMLHMLLLPVVLLWVPLIFAMAWVHEAFADLFSQLRPAPLVLARRDVTTPLRMRSRN